jgi:sugar (pentulose or hexulose) kinase
LSEDLFIGIDIGTSSIRCTTINSQKEIIQLNRINLPTPDNPHPGWYQQEPRLWWTALSKCLSDLSERLPRQSIRALAVDGTSSTVLLTDGKNQPVSTALMYNDSRASQLPSHLTDFIPTDSIARSASSSLSKALYLMQDAKARQQARYIMHQADWINAVLTGNPGISDENNCLKLGYDSVNSQWPHWISEAPFKLAEKLTHVVNGGTNIGSISKAIAAKLGLADDVQIIAGTTDSTASTLATGINQPGQAVTTYGTTMVMKVISEKPVTSVKHGIYSHHLPNGYWLVGGASNSGGNVLEKYFSIEDIEKLSTSIDPHAESGLNYYPLSSNGERFPVNDPEFEPRLSPRPDSDVLFLHGIFEGFSNIEKQAYSLIAGLDAPAPVQILTAGGKAADNAALTAIRARILGLPVSKAQHTEASYGTALIAANLLS